MCTSSWKRHYRLLSKKDKNEINANKDIGVFKRFKYRSCMKALSVCSLFVCFHSFTTISQSDFVIFICYVNQSV